MTTTEDSQLEVSFSIKSLNLLSPDIKDAIDHGLTDRIYYKVELWKSRKNWFDKLIRDYTFNFSRSVSYDPLQKRFVVHTLIPVYSDSLETSSFNNFDELASFINKREVMTVLDLSETNLKGKYYVTLTVEAELFSFKDLLELERWLSNGAVANKRDDNDDNDDSGGFIILRGITNFFSTISGLGKKDYEDRSKIFEIE